jgi:hypothetical protein
MDFSMDSSNWVLFMPWCVMDWIDCLVWLCLFVMGESRTLVIVCLILVNAKVDLGFRTIHASIGFCMWRTCINLWCDSNRLALTMWFYGCLIFNRYVFNCYRHIGTTHTWWLLDFYQLWMISRMVYAQRKLVCISLVHLISNQLCHMLG